MIGCARGTPSSRRPVQVRANPRAPDSGLARALSTAGIGTCEIDRALFTSVLESLANNALEAMPRGGSLQIDVELADRPGFLSCRVSDTGPGIPPELRDQIFDPFFTTKGGGTGLGLPIARAVVRQHGGDLLASDRPGGGTVLVATVPISQTERISGP